jgi:hypothetical protein
MKHRRMFLKYGRPSAVGRVGRAGSVCPGPQSCGRRSRGGGLCPDRRDADPQRSRNLYLRERFRGTAGSACSETGGRSLFCGHVGIAARGRAAPRGTLRSGVRDGHCGCRSCDGHRHRGLYGRHQPGQDLATSRHHWYEIGSRDARRTNLIRQRDPTHGRPARFGPQP